MSANQDLSGPPTTNTRHLAEKIQPEQRWLDRVGKSFFAGIPVKNIQITELAGAVRRFNPLKFATPEGKADGLG